MTKFLAGLSACVALFVAPGFAAELSPARQSFGDAYGISPHADWKRIETEHFRLNFPVELTDVAQKMSGYFELAHSTLTPLMKWEPGARVQVVIVDNADSANGMATPVLRFGMLMIVTPPDPWFSTAYYEDWLKLLVFHEYTHFLNMDATRGLWHPLRSLVGDVFLPNSIWPSWMLEGTAVYMETLFSEGGRGRSPYYEMVLRSAVASGVFGASSFVTLDRINGRNPFFPGGETAYLFGYEMMNRAAASALHERSGAEVLGELSAVSSGRVPFFINMNAQDVTGADWYSHWDSWTEDTRRRIEYQLERISSRPVTEPSVLTENSYQVLGSGLSPDGKLLAFTMEEFDSRMGLYVRDQSTGRIERLCDKRSGAQIAFTPDSRRIVFSSLEKQSIYSEFSDLAYFDLASRKVVRLSHALRARDPDVSPDGLHVAFTLTEKVATGLAIAELNESEDGLQLGESEVLYMPARFDRVANPRFSADGSAIYFTLHRNGTLGSELVEMRLADRSMHILVSDGHFNRFPAVGPKGELYFVSDVTGVDNLYRYVPAADGAAAGTTELRTNLKTGLYFPTIAKENSAVYAAVFSSSGSDLAQLELSAAPIDREAVTIDPPPAPLSKAVPSASDYQYEVEDYSIFPSIWPRQWFPAVYLEPRNVYLGAELLGFDALDLHHYLFGFGYRTLVEKPDVYAVYTNRSLGPSISVSAEHSTSATYVNDPVLDFVRRNRLAASVSYPVERTYSTWIPAIAMELERSNEYQRLLESSLADVLTYQSRYVPSLDFRLAYSDTQTSRLAVLQEGGRQAFAGTRLYFDSDERIWKGLLMDREFVHLGGHVVWSPSAKFMWTSRRSDHLAANALVRGRSLELIDPMPSDNFEHLGIRGYPKQPFYARAAGVVGQELWFPVSQVFRGFGTNPAYVNQLSGFVFTEAAYFPGGDPGVVALPALGAGLSLTGQVFVQVPFTTTLEYHHGLRTDQGGGPEFFLTLSLGGLSF